MSKTWKSAERAVAARIGGRRTAAQGLGQAAPDCESAWLSVEVKHRKELPAWLTGAIAQARANATPGKLPMVLLHEAGRRYDDSLVVMQLSEFLEWFVGAEVAE